MLGRTVSTLASRLRDRSPHWPPDDDEDLAVLERRCEPLRERLVAVAEEFDRLEARYDAAVGRVADGTGSTNARSRVDVRDAIEDYLDAQTEFLRVVQGLEALVIHRRLLCVERTDSTPCGYCSAGHPPPVQWLTDVDRTIISRHYDVQLAEGYAAGAFSNPPVAALVDAVLDAARSGDDVHSLPALVAANASFLATTDPVLPDTN